MLFDLMAGLIILDLISITWINFEMYLADLGPIYDENYQPIAG